MMRSQSSIRLIDIEDVGTIIYDLEGTVYDADISYNAMAMSPIVNQAIQYRVQSRKTDIKLS